MPWTEYHYQLVQEEIGLLTEPQWYSQSTITDRLDEIRGELVIAGDSLTQEDARLRRVLDDMDAAYAVGIAANEDRYDQLIGTQGRLNALVTNNKRIIPWSFTTRKIESMKIYFDRSVTDFEQRETDLQKLFEGRGDQLKAEVTETYTAQQAQLDAQLTARYLANSTIYDTLTQGINEAKNKDLRRVEEDLRGERLQYYSQWSADRIQARERAGVAFGQLTSDALGPVERRTDVVPSLSDVANLSMQIGRGTAQQLAIPGLSPTAVYTQPTASATAGG